MNFEKNKTLISTKRLQPLLKTHETDSVDATLQLAEKLGKQLEPGAVVALTGPIGSGKTHFIKGLSRGLGVKNSDEVKSPTFVLMHLYQGRLPIYHFDLYRLEKEKELETIGFDEFVSNSEAVSVIEWADRTPRRIPCGSIYVHLEILDSSRRKISIRKK